MTQPPRDHLAEIYIVGTKTVGKRHGLMMLCTRCGGPELFADGGTVASVLAAANSHIGDAEKEGA